MLRSTLSIFVRRRTRSTRRVCAARGDGARAVSQRRTAGLTQIALLRVGPEAGSHPQAISLLALRRGNNDHFERHGRCDVN